MIPNIVIIAIYFLNYGYDVSGAIPLTMTGGHPSDSRSNNFLVSIHTAKYGFFGTQRRCGGSTISTTYVITTANCVEGIEPKDVLVRIGSSYIKADIHIHQFYQNNTRENDISLLHLQKVLTFNTTLGAIGLLESPGEYSYSVGDEIRAIGFDEGGNGIRVADLKIVNSTECEIKLKLSISNSRFCAGNGNITLSRDDEGSPVTNGDKLIGIVSLIAEHSTQGLSVIVKVSHYNEFIENITGTHPKKNELYF